MLNEKKIYFGKDEVVKFRKNHILDTIKFLGVNGER